MLTISSTSWDPSRNDLQSVFGVLPVLPGLCILYTQSATATSTYRDDMPWWGCQWRCSRKPISYINPPTWSRQLKRPSFLLRKSVILHFCFGDSQINHAQDLSRGSPQIDPIALFANPLLCQSSSHGALQMGTAEGELSSCVACTSAASL